MVPKTREDFGDGERVTVLTETSKECQEIEAKETMNAHPSISTRTCRSLEAREKQYTSITRLEG